MLRIESASHDTSCNSVTPPYRQRRRETSALLVLRQGRRPRALSLRRRGGRHDLRRVLPQSVLHLREGARHIARPACRRVDAPVRCSGRDDRCRKVVTGKSEKAERPNIMCPSLQSAVVHKLKTARGDASWSVMDKSTLPLQRRPRDPLRLECSACRRLSGSLAVIQTLFFNVLPVPNQAPSSLSPAEPGRT